MKNFRISRVLFLVGLAVFLIFGTSNISFGQTADYSKTSSQNKETEEKLEPSFKGYQEVMVGMTNEEVKEKLGKPKVEDKDGFFYVVSKEEQVQIGLDENKKVRVIVIMYDDKNGIAPKYEDVFGKKFENSPQANGKVYDLVQYPDSGYWVAYSRISGEHPSVTITVQKMAETLKN